jgi:hypothetical protein
MKIDKTTRNRWEKYVRLYLQEKGYAPKDITDYGQMWSIAFELSIPREAYHMDSSTNDNHIDTALLRIFPNVKRSKA